jgi:hypothetical protein
VLFFGAPWILGVFGQGYADAATPLLRWFAVGAVLRVVMETYFAVLRAQSRTSGLAWLQGLLCLLVLGLTVILLPRMGLTGAGVAEISSLAVIVAIAAPRLYRIVRAAPADAVPEDAAPDGDLADLGAREVPASQQARRRRGAARPGRSGSTRTRWRSACSSTSTTWSGGRTYGPVRGPRPSGRRRSTPEHREPRPTTGRPGRSRRPSNCPPSVEVGLPVEEREPGSETSLGPSEVEVDAPFEPSEGGSGDESEGVREQRSSGART